MTVTALTAAANGITIQRQVYQHSTTIKLVIKLQAGGEHTVLISDSNGDPYIQELTAAAYPLNADAGCDNEFVPYIDRASRVGLWFGSRYSASLKAKPALFFFPIFEYKVPKK